MNVPRAKSIAVVALMLAAAMPSVLGGQQARADEFKKPKLKSRTLLVEAPSKSGIARATAFYTRGEGLDMACYANVGPRGYLGDTWQRRFSSDNGRTWSDWEILAPYETKTAEGVLQKGYKPGWVDPETGRLLTMVSTAKLTSGGKIKHEHFICGVLRYCVSTDGGKTWAVDEPVIQKGDYTAEHPIDGVWIGKNAFLMGATTMRPIRTRSGRILVPIQITPLDDEGKLANPGGGSYYLDSGVLIGSWTDGMKIEWEAVGRVAADPARSTQGCYEPTLAEMPDGRILMVVRGSNNHKAELPGHKWYSVSKDGGRNWSELKPWGYTDGAKFFSPSSCSQFVHHSSGRYYWIGNICPKNPYANLPRRPLVIGRVDPQDLMLVKQSVAVIDTTRPGDPGDVNLSNFMAHEDRENGDILVYSSRLFGGRGNTYVYRIEP